MLGTVINDHKGLRHIEDTLALCQNRVHMPILSVVLEICVSRSLLIMITFAGQPICLMLTSRALYGHI